MLLDAHPIDRGGNDERRRPSESCEEQEGTTGTLARRLSTMATSATAARAERPQIPAAFGVNISVP
jgi:uncharacterized protein (DUF3084 family)